MATKQRTHTDRPAPQVSYGGDPFLINSELSKINNRRKFWFRKSRRAVDDYASSVGHVVDAASIGIDRIG